MRGVYFFPFTLVFIIGMSAHWILPLLLPSLLGSAINIPLTQVRSGPIVSRQVVNFFGTRYIIPIVERRQLTIVAI